MRQTDIQRDRDGNREKGGKKEVQKDRERTRCAGQNKTFSFYNLLDPLRDNNRSPVLPPEIS